VQPRARGGDGRAPLLDRGQHVHRAVVPALDAVRPEQVRAGDRRALGEERDRAPGQQRDHRQALRDPGQQAGRPVQEPAGGGVVDDGSQDAVEVHDEAGADPGPGERADDVGAGGHGPDSGMPPARGQDEGADPAGPAP
jgi:hypothetical protein